MPAKLQGDDFKTSAELATAGGDDSGLLKEGQIYIAALGKRFDESRADGDLLKTENNGDADAVATKGISVTTGNKTAGTGDSGDIDLAPGTSAGGDKGKINFGSLKEIFASDDQLSNFWFANVAGIFGDSEVLDASDQVVFFASTDTEVVGTSTASIYVGSGDQVAVAATAQTGSVDSKSGDVTDSGASAGTGPYNAKSGDNQGTGGTGSARFSSGVQFGSAGNTGTAELFSGGSANGNSGEVQIGSGTAPNGDRGRVRRTGHLYNIDVATKIPTGTAQTIDWNQDFNFVAIDLQSATGDVTLTLSNPPTGSIATYYIKAIQGSVARDLIWPGNVLWPGGTAPVISAADDAIDLIKLQFDGTNYLGTFEQAFA